MNDLKFSVNGYKKVVSERICTCLVNDSAPNTLFHRRCGCVSMGSSLLNFIAALPVDTHNGGFVTTVKC